MAAHPTESDFDYTHRKCILFWKCHQSEVLPQILLEVSSASELQGAMKEKEK